MKIVRIEWMDAVSGCGWSSAPSTLTANHSAGYVVHEDDDCIQVATTLCPECGIWNATMTIPKNNITVQETLYEIEDENSED